MIGETITFHQKPRRRSNPKQQQHSLSSHKDQHRQRTGRIKFALIMLLNTTQNHIAHVAAGHATADQQTVLISVYVLYDIACKHRHTTTANYKTLNERTRAQPRVLRVHSSIKSSSEREQRSRPLGVRCLLHHAGRAPFVQRA